MDETGGAPTILEGRFRVQKVIGAGGMGIVYQIQAIADGQKFALKTLLPGRRPASDTLARFVREAKTLMRLDHPHIVKVFESGELQDGTPFMLMELLHGRDLREEFRIRRHLPIQEIAGYAVQVCDALDKAHAAGVVHRDIKPQNMYVTKLRRGRIIKLLDFGISKLADPVDVALTASHDAFGTPSYMSPEQVKASRYVDQRTDIWSMGVVLYYLLTGRLPFDGASVSAVIAAIPTHDPDPPSKFAAMPPELERLILRCLAKAPEGRFQSAEELRDALAPFGPPDGRSCRGEPIAVVSTLPPVPVANPGPLLQPFQTAPLPVAAYRVRLEEMLGSPPSDDVGFGAPESTSVRPSRAESPTHMDRAVGPHAQESGTASAASVVPEPKAIPITAPSLKRQAVALALVVVALTGALLGLRSRATSPGLLPNDGTALSISRSTQVEAPPPVVPIAITSAAAQPTASVPVSAAIPSRPVRRAPSVRRTAPTTSAAPHLGDRFPLSL